MKRDDCMWQATADVLTWGNCPSYYSLNALPSSWCPGRSWWGRCYPLKTVEWFVVMDWHDTRSKSTMSLNLVCWWGFTALFREWLRCHVGALMENYQTVHAVTPISEFNVEVIAQHHSPFFTILDVGIFNVLQTGFGRITKMRSLL